MNHKSKLEQKQQSIEHQQQTEHVFESPEEMLRYDAQHTEVPPAVATRLEESLAKQPPPQPWWRRWFS